jgi:hypothetical protein
MTEAELAGYFQQHLGNERLHVQAMLADRHLTVIFNRTVDLELDYPEMKRQVIAEVKKLRLKQLESINIVGRIWGEHDPEWQTTLKIKSKKKPSASSSQTASTQAKSKPSDRQSQTLTSNQQSPSTDSPPAKTRVITQTELQPETEPAIADSEPVADAETKQPKKKNYAEFNLIAPDIDDEDDSDLYSGSLNTTTQKETVVKASTAVQPASNSELEVSDRTNSSQDQDANPESQTNDTNLKPGDLSEFCFSRNKHLVKTDLANPDLDVAEAVMFFHNLSESDKVLLAPVLNDFFADPKKTEISHLLPEWQEWLQKLKKLSNLEFRSTSVWLSRYCLDRDRTMKQVNATLGFKSDAATIDDSDRPEQAEPTVDISIADNSSFDRSESGSKESQLNDNAMPEVGMAYQKQVLTDIKYVPRSRSNMRN